MSWEPPISFDHPTLPSFPRVFSDWLQRFIDSTSKSIQVAPDLMGMLVLGTLATATQGRYRVQIKRGYSEPLNLFLCCALPPGCRKSAAFSLATKPLEDYEQEQAAFTSSLIKSKATERRVIQQAICNAESKAARTLDEGERDQWMQRVHTLTSSLESCEVAHAPRLMADDVTPQKLVSLLQQHKRISVMSSEAGVFSKMASSATMDVYLKSWAGETIAVDRQSRASTHIRNPLLTIALTVQPSVLSDLGGKAAMHDRGLLGRILFSLPENLMGRREANPPSVPQEYLNEYRRNIRWLLNNKSNNAPLRFSSDALTSWVRFVASLEPRLRVDGDLGNMTEWAGKLAGHVARIAGLLHVARHLTDSRYIQISASTVDAAITIGHYFIDHARAAFNSMHLDERVFNAQHVLQWIKANNEPSFRLRDAYQALKGNRRFRTMARLRDPIELLTEHHYIRELQILQYRRPGRKPSPTYEVSPLVISRSNGNCRNNGHRQRMLPFVVEGGDACVM